MTKKRTVPKLVRKGYQMSERLYDYLKVTDLKDMLNKTKEMYGEKSAYKIRVEEEKYKI